MDRKKVFQEECKDVKYYQKNMFHSKPLQTYKYDEVTGLPVPNRIIPPKDLPDLTLDLFSGERLNLFIHHGHIAGE